MTIWKGNQRPIQWSQEFARYIWQRRRHLTQKLLLGHICEPVYGGAQKHQRISQQWLGPTSDTVRCLGQDQRAKTGYAERSADAVTKTIAGVQHQP